MRFIENFRQVFPRLWTVWIISIAIALTLVEIFMADTLASLVTPLQMQLLQLVMLIAAMVARGLVQDALQQHNTVET